MLVTAIAVDIEPELEAPPSLEVTGSTRLELAEPEVALVDATEVACTMAVQATQKREQAQERMMQYSVETAEAIGHIWVERIARGEQKAWEEHME